MQGVLNLKNNSGAKRLIAYSLYGLLICPNVRNDDVSGVFSFNVPFTHLALFVSQFIKIRGSDFDSGYVNCLFVLAVLMK
jgi:hypothetical protein